MKLADRPLASLLPYLTRYRRPLWLGTTMVLLTNLAAACQPWVLGRAVDDLTLEVTRNKLLVYAVVLVGLSVVEGAFRFFMRHILIGTSRKVEFDLRNDLFSHLMRLTPSFYQRSTTGDLMSRATNDLSAVRSVLGPGIMYSLNTVFTTVLAVGLLISINASLAALTLIPLIAVTASTRYFGQQIHQRFKGIQKQFSEITSLVQENVAGMRVVKAYNQEPAFIRRFSDSNRDYVERSLGLARISGLYNPSLSFLLGVSSVALLGFGGWKVMQGEISLGELVAFMSYLAMLTWPTIALGWVINVVERGSASMGRINELLRSRPEISSPSPAKGRISEGRIEVTNLSFSYNGAQVLDRISFQIPPGSTVAVVGSTGSGKSTLANLLCHFYPVPRGCVSIDGYDLNDFSLAELRRGIAYVPQDTFLFSETIRANLAFGQPDANVSQIEEAARISDIWPDIQDFPDQLNTLVGERGVTLSGGQKQRIAISRALLVEAPILLLDDSLSSVDTQTEERILQGLARQLQNRTAILISHRISTIKSADQILVMDAGRIVERGTHDQLISLDGAYRQLHERQLLREELGIE